MNHRLKVHGHGTWFFAANCVWIVAFYAGFQLSFKPLARLNTNLPLSWAA